MIPAWEIIGPWVISIAGFIAAVSVIAAAVVKLLKRITGPSQAVRAALRYSITSACEQYQKEGGVSYQELQNLLDMYEQYRALSGNGFVVELVEAVKKLPVKS